MKLLRRMATFLLLVNNEKCIGKICREANTPSIYIYKKIPILRSNGYVELKPIRRKNIVCLTEKGTALQNELRILRDLGIQ